MNPVLSSADLERIYRARFAGKGEGRQQVWRVLARFFARWVPPDAAVLDLGSGYCEFINSIRCARKFALDLNPEAQHQAADDVTVLLQDCADPWPLPSNSLDVVFTSNFLEHLPNKHSVQDALVQAYRSLRPGGRLIAVGPNIKYARGRYWDFFDHYVPLTELSLAEALGACGFTLEFCRARFLPYTMAHGRQYPALAVRVYLALPIAWRLFGKQFLLIARKPA